MAFLVITLICYIVVALIRKTSVKNEWLPLISGGLGLVLGLLAFYAFPSIVPSNDLGVAVAYGFFCGLAATGSNQILKQALKYIAAKYNLHLPSNNIDDKKEE